MPSQLDVVNQVLNELGFPAVDKVTDQPNAQVIAAKTTVLLAELLLRTDWNFAIKYVTDNTPLTINFSPDFNYSYQLPGDYLRLDRFSWLTTGQAFGFYYRIIDGLILTNAKPINYYYVVNVQDYGVLPPLFYRTLVLYVASACAPSLTQNVALSQYLEKKYMEKLSDAIRENDMDRYIQSAPYNDFDRAAYI